MANLTSKPIADMSDLELLDLYCETCFPFIDPRVINPIQQRGLYSIISTLSGTLAERKAEVRAKLSQSGKYTGDPEIEQIASIVERIKRVQKQIAVADPAQANNIIMLCETLTNVAGRLQNFYE